MTANDEIRPILPVGRHQARFCQIDRRCAEGARAQRLASALCTGSEYFRDHHWQDGISGQSGPASMA